MKILYIDYGNVVSDNHIYRYYGDLFRELQSLAQVYLLQGVPADINNIIKAFPQNSHAMGALTSLEAALSTFYPESKNIDDADENYRSMCRLIAQVPILAANFYRHSQGLDFINPDDSLDYAENFLNMMSSLRN